MLFQIFFVTLQSNQAAKRNIERFPDDFMFQLTKGEWEILKSQIATSSLPDNQEVDSLTSQIVTLNNGRGQHRKFFTTKTISMKAPVCNLIRLSTFVLPARKQNVTLLQYYIITLSIFQYAERSVS